MGAEDSVARRFFDLSIGGELRSIIIQVQILMSPSMALGIGDLAVSNDDDVSFLRARFFRMLGVCLNFHDEPFWILIPHF